MGKDKSAVYQENITGAKGMRKAYYLLVWLRSQRKSGRVRVKDVGKIRENGQRNPKTFFNSTTGLILIHLWKRALWFI